MKVQIRNGVFETNSSSSHSVVVMKEGQMVPPEEAARDAYKGVMTIWDGDDEFGRSPFNVLTSWRDKMRYAVASAYQKEERDKIIQTVIDYVPGLEEIKFPVIHNKWRRDDPDKEPRYDYGSVDHQSSGLYYSVLNGEKITAKDFIFNTRYIVIIDGDEYCIFDQMVNRNLINRDGVEKIYDIYTY